MRVTVGVVGRRALARVSAIALLRRPLQTKSATWYRGPGRARALTDIAGRR